MTLSLAGTKRPKRADVCRDNHLDCTGREVLVEKQKPKATTTGMKVHTFNLHTQKAERGKSVISSQPGLYSKFQANQGHMVRSCFQKGQGRTV